MGILLQTILERFNKDNHILQKPELDLSSIYDLICSIQQFIIHKINTFDEYDNLAMNLSAKIMANFEVI